VILLETGVILVLDLDDTLYPERTYVRGGLLEVDRWVQASWGCTGFFDLAWRAFLSGARGRLFDEVLAELGIEPGPTSILTMVETYRNHEPAIGLYPDARRLLSRVPGLAELALITDGAAASQRRKIAALGLEHVVQHIVVTDELGRDSWKPSVIPFELVARATGAEPRRLAYLGDNVRKDFVAPNALGWQTIRVVRGDSVHADCEPESASHAAHRTIRSLDKITWMDGDSGAAGAGVTQTPQGW
jgi:putative hydrolase of the HAD superfamily